MLKLIMTRKINKYLEEHHMSEAVEKFGLNTLVKCKILNEIPGSILYRKGDNLYTTSGEEFYAKYVMHFANGNTIVSHSIMNLSQTGREKRYFVIDGVGNDLTEMYNNIIPCPDYVVLTNTDKHVDSNKNALIVNMVGGVIDTKHHVLCYPRLEEPYGRVFQTRDIDEKGKINRGHVIIDNYCNIKDYTPKATIIEY